MQAQSCKDVLDKTGLTPQCPQDGCETLREWPSFHQMCAQMERPMPVQNIGVYNSQTQQWKFSTDPASLFKMAQELHNQDPNWNLSNCYCCCGAA